MIGKLLCIMVNLSVIALSLLIFFIPSGSPPLVLAGCLKSLLGNFQNAFLETITEILIHVPDQMFLAFTSLAAAYYAIFVMFAGISCLLFICWSNFQSVRKPENEVESIMMYRKLQVWERSLNESVKGRLFGSAMFLIPVVQVVATTLLLSIGSQLRWDRTLFVAAFSADAMIYSFATVSFAAVILSTSTKWLERERRQWQRSKYMRRVDRSLRPLRIEFGSNFADKTTALVVQDVCWRQIVGFCLMSRSGST